MARRVTVRALRRHWFVFPLVAGVTATGLFFWSSRRPIPFEARAELLLRSLPGPVDTVPVRSIATHHTRVALITSTPVLEDAVLGPLHADFPGTARGSPEGLRALAEAVHRIRANTEVEQDPDRTIIIITVQDSNAERATRVANAVAETFASTSRQMIQDGMTRILSRVNRDLQRERETLLQVKADLEKLPAQDRTPEEHRANQEALRARQPRILEEIEALRRTQEEALAEAEEIGPLVGQPDFEVVVKPGDLPRTESTLRRLNEIEDQLAEWKPQAGERDLWIRTLTDERSRLRERLDATRRNEIRELRRIRKGDIIRRLRELERIQEKAQTHRSKLESKLGDLQKQIEQINIPEQSETADRRRHLAEQKAIRSRKIESLLEEREQLSAAKAYLDQGTVAELQPARQARSLERTPPLEHLAFFVLIGLIAGGSVAFLLEWTSTKIRNEGDIRRYVNLPLLGVIGRIRLMKNRLLVRQAPGSVVSEEFHTIGTLIETFAEENEAKTFLITSPLPKEGKSTIASNLAVAIARGGKRVVLIDGDLRRATLHRIFELDRSPGLSDFLQPVDESGGDEDEGRAQLRLNQIFRSTSVPKLTLVTAGGVSENPVPLLKSNALNHVLEQAREEADIVLIDGPPVKPAVDSLILAGKADGTLLLVSAGETRKESVATAKRLLESANGRLFGCLLNKATERNGTYYTYSQTHDPVSHYDLES